MKGISPLVAIVLIIGVTVVVASIIFLWLSGFTRTTTEKIGKEAETSIGCAGGNIKLQSLRYCKETGFLTGIVDNIGTIELKNITLRVDYPSKPPAEIFLCSIDNIAFNCSVSNLTISPTQFYWFNLSVESGMSEVSVRTSCPGVFHRVSSDEIIYTC